MHLTFDEGVVPPLLAARLSLSTYNKLLHNPLTPNCFGGLENYQGAERALTAIQFDSIRFLVHYQPL